MTKYRTILVSLFHFHYKAFVHGRANKEAIFFVQVHNVSFSGYPVGKLCTVTSCPLSRFTVTSQGPLYEHTALSVQLPLAYSSCVGACCTFRNLSLIPARNWMQAPVLEHFLDAFEPLCGGLSESSVAMQGGRVSTRVDRVDPLNFLVDKKCSCVGMTPVWE